jgi:hypothetical protein
VLLQSEAPALDDRISEPCGVRKADEISLGCCQPNRVQANIPPMLGQFSVDEFHIGVC